MSELTAPRSPRSSLPIPQGYPSGQPDGTEPNDDIIDAMPTAGPLAGREQEAAGGSGQQPEGGAPETWNGPAEPVLPHPVRVDLLPPENRQRLVLSRAKRRTVMMLAGSLILVLLITAVSFLQAGSAESELEQAQQDQTAAQAQVSKYAEVPKVAAELAAIRKSLTEALGSEVLFSEMLSSVAGSIPEGVSLTALGFDLGTTKKGTKTTTSGGKAGTLPTSPNAGTVTFTGTAPNLDAVSLFLDQLEKNKDFQDVALTSATRETASSTTTGSTTTGTSKTTTPTPTGYTFEGTAALSKEALSNRYAAEEAKTS